MVAAIRSHQWRQGSVVPTAMHYLLQEHAPRVLTEEDCCLVLSQSCDVVHHDLAVEPVVELVLAKPLQESAVDGTYTYAKNARRLHFLINTGQSQLGHEALARERFSIPRRHLATLPPDGTRRLDPAELRSLLTWIMARYGRPAFPDNFNGRVGSAAEKKIRQVLKRLLRLKSLYASLNAWDELPEGKDYQVYLVGTLQVEDFRDPAVRLATEKGMLEIAASLSVCKGIVVKNAEVQSEATITLDHLRNLVRWNLDFISLQDADGHVFAGLDL